MAAAKKEAATEEAGTDVAVKQQQALAAMNSMFEADAGTGFEEADASAYAIPFIQILQSGSPQCKKSDGAYIKGAEEGMFYNTVTQELYSGETGILVIPCHYSNRFIEWKTRESGGGFVAEHMPDHGLTTVKDDKNRDVLPNGNTLVDTRNHYVLLVKADGMVEPALITMSSTQLKKSRNWMSKMNGIKLRTASGMQVTAPMASRMYRLTTVPEQNDKGSWFGFKTELEAVVQDPSQYQAAQEFAAAVKSGSAKANMAHAEATGPAGDTAPEEF